MQNPYGEISQEQKRKYLIDWRSQKGLYGLVHLERKGPGRIFLEREATVRGKEGWCFRSAVLNIAKT